MDFLDRQRLIEHADAVVQLIFTSTRGRIVSLLDGREVGGVVKVFTGDGLFKSLQVN